MKCLDTYFKKNCSKYFIKYQSLPIGKCTALDEFYVDSYILFGKFLMNDIMYYEIIFKVDQNNITLNT